MVVETGRQAEKLEGARVVWLFASALGTLAHWALSLSQRRWFVLDISQAARVRYFEKSDESSQPLGTFYVRRAGVREETSLKKQNVLAVSAVDSSRTYYLCADSREEMNAWSAAFNRALDL